MRRGDQRFMREQLEALDRGGDGDASKRELSTQRNQDTNSSASTQDSSKSSSPSAKSKSYQPRGTIELPVRYEDGCLVVDQSAVRTTVSCNVPGERWSANLSGSSLIKGPIGAATGSLFISYNVLQQGNTLQAVSQIAVGDRANSMCGAMYHTDTAWYGAGAYYYPRALSLGPRYEVQLKSEQSLEYGKLHLKCSVPTETLRPNTTVSFSNKSLQIQLGMVKARPHVEVSISPRISSHRKLKVSCQMRKGRTKVDVSLKQALSKGSSLGMGIRHDSRQGLSWLVTWIRGDVTINVPIFLLKHTAPLQYVCSACLVSYTSYMIQELLADLWKLNDKQQQQLPRSNRKSRAAADRERLLMVRQANSRRDAEEKKQGLVIAEATYFCLGGDSWDVTTQLQFWTAKSSIDLPALSKQGLLGFYNVAAPEKSAHNRDDAEPEWWRFWKPTRRKLSKLESAARIPKLSVKYVYAGELYEISIQDEEPLSLPSSRARRLDSGKR